MPWSNGVYTRSNGVFTGTTVWASDASVGTNITTSHHDTHDQDIATGLNNCVTVDGLNKIAANFVPTIDGAYNLGSASFRWGNAYFAGNVTGGTFVNSVLTSPTITSPTLTSPTITGAVSGPSIVFAPQGRLTLSSTNAVMQADVVGGTGIYYLPYSGLLVPTYTGTALSSLNIGTSGLGLALDSTSGHTGYQESGNNFDLFVFSNSGVVTLGTGPAWSTATARGTGASTTQITQSVGGFWTNAVQIALKIDATATQVTVPANEATYVGTMYASTDGQCTMQMTPAPASDGSNPIMGLWNAYNQVITSCYEQDTTTSWTYATAAFRNANGQTTNVIRYVDGLAESPVSGSYGASGSTSGGQTGLIGLERNWTSGNPSGAWAAFDAGSGAMGRAFNNWSPTLGLSTISALEYASGATVSFSGTNNLMDLRITLEM